MNQPHITPETIEYTNLSERGLIEQIFDVLGTEIHHISADKGFYTAPKTAEELVDALVDPRASDTPDWLHDRDALRTKLAELVAEARATVPRSEAELIALEHSELSEALEGARGGSPPDDKLPQFPSQVVELADAVIRICDHAKFKNYPLGAAIRAKIAYNRTRPIKHGKKF